jgi:hypothetical protein
VISELDTWIFKNGRPDHMSGANDDLLTCLAMGLFVAQYYMLRTDRIKTKDAVIVKSWFINNSDNTDIHTKHLHDNMNISKSEARKISPFTNAFKPIDDKAFTKACVMLGGFKTNK